MLQALQQELISLREQNQELEWALEMQEADLRADSLIEMAEELPPHQRPSILSASLH
jgi:Mg2+/Co2+ transporter CorB